MQGNRESRSHNIPVTLILLVLGLLFFHSQLRVLGLHFPVYQGPSSNVEGFSGRSGWQVIADWKKLSPGLKNHLPPGLSPAVGVVESLGDKPLSSLYMEVDQELFQGEPGLVARYRSEEVSIQANLYQAATGLGHLSGPIEVTVGSDLVKPNLKGVSLDALDQLPLSADKILLADRTCLLIPGDLKSKMKEQWERWEFFPYEDLNGVLGNTVVVSMWEGGAVLLAEVESQTRVRELIEKRFPDSVIRTTSSIVQGTTVTGFYQGRKPAWCFWGDYLIATPEGGVDRLSGFLEERFQNALSFRPESFLAGEVRRLGGRETGWHLCLIEKDRGRSIRWAVLLRWSDLENRTARGFLTVEVLPESVQ